MWIYINVCAREHGGVIVCARARVCVRACRPYMHSVILDNLLTYWPTDLQCTSVVILHCTWSRECIILWFCCATELGFSEDIGAKEVILLFYYYSNLAAYCCRNLARIHLIVQVSSTQRMRS